MIDPNSRGVQVGALLDKLAQEVALGRLGDVDDVVLFFRGNTSALICVDGTRDMEARTKQLLEDALEWMNTGNLRPRT